MRHFLLILMIALLPLRGWMGDVMAVEMTQQAISPASITTYSVANNDHSMPGMDHFYTPASPAQAEHPCPDHAAASPGDGSRVDMQATTDCSTCTSCQVCHAVAVVMTAPAPATLAMAATAPLTTGSAFTSVVAARGFKPPIF